MIFNFLLIIFWFLALVLPVGDYHKYIESFSDARTTVPDKYAHLVLVSEKSLSFLPPPPAPVPRFSPLVVPVYSPVEAKDSTHTRFSRSKRILTIYRWVDEFFTHITNLLGRPRPTKTYDSPTRVIAPLYPAPPTPGSHVLNDIVVVSPTCSATDPARLWATYKLVLGWVSVTCFSLVIALGQFLSRGYSTAKPVDSAGSRDANPATPHLASYGSIVDIYYSLNSPEFITVPSDLTHPRVSPESVSSLVAMDGELLELADCRSSAPANPSSALPTWIDTKTGVEGITDSNGTLAGGKILEPAMSKNSTSSIIHLYTGGSLVITPSASLSSIPSTHSIDVLSALGDDFPLAGQVHTPRSKLWLEGLIRHVADMQSRGNFYGRVYDNWSDNPDLRAGEGSSAGPLTAQEGDLIDSTGYTTLPQDSPVVGLTSPPPMSTSTNPVSEADSPTPIGDLSITVSQGSLYDRLGGFVNHQAQQREGDVVEIGTRSVDDDIHEVEGDSSSLMDSEAADVPLRSSPCVQDAPITSLDEPEIENSSAISINPISVPPPPNPCIKPGSLPLIRPLVIRSKRKRDEVPVAEKMSDW
ncbi:hypothetical protein OPQ81_009074 [Rhizoctonia solani]|nr:hypothetical protein OPQ81_009074 [Rhizoctonia solani]